MRRRPVALYGAVCAVALGGCGDGGEHVQARDREAITKTVRAAYHGFIYADNPELCAQLTPDAERALTNVLTGAAPASKGTTCERLFFYVYHRVPLNMQPRFANEVAHWKGDGITADGDGAKVRFKDGATWELRRIDGRWLIDDLPILPRGWKDPSGKLSD